MYLSDFFLAFCHRSRTPEYCFRRDQGNPQYFKNESWQTTNLGELLQQMLQCYDSRVRVEHGGSK